MGKGSDDSDDFNENQINNNPNMQALSSSDTS
jgi:hypothetical protein